MREYGSEHPAIILPDGYFDKFSEFKRNYIFLRSGREALLLAAIALSIQKEYNRVGHLIVFSSIYFEVIKC